MRAATLLLTLVLGSAAGARAEPVALSGKMTDGSGPAADVTVALVALRHPAEAARQELEGVEPPPVVSTTTDAAGRYRLEAPEPGFWRLIAGGGSHARHALDFVREPLLEATHLPPLELRAASKATVTVVNPAGEPLRGAWLSITVEEGPRRIRRGLYWGWHLPFRYTAEDGTAILTVPTEGDARIEAGHARYSASDDRALTGDLQITLEHGTERELLVVDGDGRPVADLPVRPDGGPAVAKTDADGRVSLTGEATTLLASLVLDDGRIARPRLTGTDGADGDAFRTTLPEPRTVQGTVVAGEARQPVADAWVFPMSAPARRVLTDGRGRFSIDVEDRDGLTLFAAAAGHLTDRAQTGTPGLVTLVLQPTLALGGIVFDPLGEPAADAEIRAFPHVESSRAMRRAFSDPVRHATSDADGRFELRGLPAEGAYLVTAKRPGLAEAEALVRDLPARAAEGIVLTLSTGAAIVGVVTDGRSRGIGGVELRLAPEQDDFNRMLSRARGRGADRALVAYSNSDGGFGIPAVPAGRFELTASAAGFADTELPTVEVELGVAEVDLGLFTLDAGVDLSGVVTDLDGMPLDRASIDFRPTDAGMSFSMPEESSVTTGADGRFTISDRRDGELLDLTVDRDGYAEKSVPRVAVSATEELEVRLTPGASLSGRVLGDDGAPIASARVTVARGGGRAGTSTFGMRGSLVAKVTDDDGRFLLEDIEPTLVTLSVDAHGWLPTEISEIRLVAGDEPQEYEIELVRGATVEGRVLMADGTPAVGATVAVEAEGRTFNRGTTTATAGDGSYSLAGVEPGRRVLGARTDQGLYASDEIDVQATGNTLDLVMPGGVEVAGQVVDDDGRALPGALVMLRSGGSYSATHQDRSGDDGSFSIEPVPPGRYTVMVEHADFASASLPDPVEVADGPVLGIEVRLGTGAALVGTVSGLADSELPGVEVVAFQRSTNHWKQGKVDRDARYRIGGLGDGDWQVMAQTQKGQSLTRSVEIPQAAQEVTLDLDFAAEEGLTLTGQVLNRGEPVSDAVLVAQGIEGARGGSARTDHEGRFNLQNLPPGRYRLRISAFATGMSHSEEIELLRDDSITIDFEGVTLAGVVIDESSGQPLARAQVKLEALDDDDHAWLRTGKSAATDSAGHFLLTDISEGDYQLRVSRSGFATRTQRWTVSRTGPAEVEISLAPVEGVTLEVRFPAGGAVSRISYAAIDALGTPGASGYVPVPSDGVVSLQSVPDGDWTLLVTANDSATATLAVRAPTDEAAITLEPAAHANFRVAELVDDALATATLRLVSPRGESYRTVGGNTVHKSWQLYRGERFLRSLAPGRWIATIEATDGRRWERSIDLVAGANDPIVFE